MQRHVLVCYDIRDPKRLRRVHRVVRDFGLPAQYSVFSCRLSEQDRAKLVARLLNAIDQRIDAIMLVDLGAVKAGEPGLPGATLLGAQEPAARPDLVIV